MTDLGDAAARDLISTDGLGETLFVEAGAGSGKTTSLVARVRSIVLAEGVPLRHVAAVTFTEKAATELRDRLRVAFEADARAGDPRAAQALDDLDCAAIGTLHAFAQRVLAQHPIEAGLPPLIEIGDEVSSGVRFDERWAALRAELLDDESLTETLLLAMAAGLKVDHLRALTAEFTRNWDLIEPRVLAEPPPPLPVIDVASLVARARALADRRADCPDATDRFVERLEALAGWAVTLDAATDDGARLAALGSAAGLKWSYGRAGNWPDLAGLRAGCRELAEAAADLRCRVLDAALRRLAHRIGRATLAEAAARRAEGRLEFHDLLVLARQLLRDPAHGPAVRESLHRAYPRLLLDEFQDTDPIQIELAVRIAAGAAGDAASWEDVAVPDGALFVVGDPKQSIYRFRRADIATYLRAQERIGRPVVLDTNFRTTRPIVDWINAVFARLIVAEPDSQPAYRPLRAERDPAPAGPAVLTLGGAHTAAMGEVREREAADVVAAVQTALRERWQVCDTDTERWRDVRLADIAVLLPARTSLPFLEAALDAAGIGYAAGASSLVYRTAEVRDLLAAARAADDPSDELALVTALRSPLFGCGDDDLYAWRCAGGRLNLFAADGPGPVGDGIAYLRRLHHDRAWLAPSEVLARLVDDRRMWELAADTPRGRDVWRRLRYVVDQARAWSDAEHGGLRGYLAWAARQGSETARVAEAVLPETDTDALRLMTVHSAKGLEFPMVIVSGLGSQPRRDHGLKVLWPRAGGYAVKLGENLRTADFDAAWPVDEQMGFHERLRLLYVACTRARDHLVVSLHHKGRQGAPASPGRQSSAELVAAVLPPTPAFTGLTGAPAAGPPVAPPAAAPPPWDEWAAYAGRAAASSRRPAAVSASSFEGAFAAAPVDALGEPVDAGLAKLPRDLELPPWSKGRYGTAVGRAVHGALQTVDLATGAGLADAVAAQVLAEGVTDYAELVASLVTAALASPVVQAAAARPHWRESYVGTTVGDRVLEGVVDLLYRDEDGLVVVDYKTDAVPAAALTARAAFYRPQLAAYAAAVEAATGEPVARCVLLFLNPERAAAVEVADLPGALAQLRAEVLAG